MREFVVEADGGSRGNPGPAGYGAVVSDAATGETLAEAAEYIGVATNNVAEYRGLLAGLRAARDLDPEAGVHVRMDSKLVIEQMSGRWKIKHPAMKPLAAEAATVFPPGQVTYEWIPRERNTHADRLANEAMDAGKRGEQWSPAASRADLDTPSAVPAPEGPPGDATAGAARVRAAMTPTAAGRAAEARAARAAETADRPPAPGGDADGPASTGRATESRDAGTSAERPAAGARSGGPGSSAAHRPVTDTPASGAGARAGASGGDAGLAAVAGADADRRAAQAVATPSSGWAPADMGAPATFVLLRHGETPLTPQKRFSGSGGSDPSLSDIGREQAEKVAAALARRGTVQAVVASPLARTRETARIVAARLGLDVAVEEGLRETDFGAWEGLTFGEVRERHPEDLNAWLASPDVEPTGGGESFAATAARVAEARDTLLAAYRGRTVLLVTHVTPIKTLIRLALGAPPEALYRMELSAASLSAVAYYADGNASVRLFNDTSHLR
ncbi:bifunctional RNase H/acid phosphatase [Streptomyces tendae]|uniref:Bifunctional RNase H/acid phosphatase n=1 Tax=Streptomyces tendae TaxID=1932 RepID=A0ABX5ZW97_STRTE|nr:bifunctional RNase H/acid phosphatase [Streptomyces tendae]QER88688.1 bifunctional RNase H/acid phosphatase [Streptomyces tendae]